MTSILVNLIDSDSYYSSRKKLIAINLIPAISVFISTYLFDFALWIKISSILVFAVWFLIILKYQRKINGYFGNRKMEISEKQIKILSKKNELIEEIELKDLERIELLKKYQRSDSTHGNLIKILLNNRPTYFILHYKDRNLRLNFEIDSHFQEGKFEKILSTWKNSELKIQYINHE